MIVAGVLHDVVEDSGFLTAGDVSDRFGAEVGRLVAALTEDPSISDWAKRKAALRDQAEKAGPAAVTIYTADKVANLRDWHVVYANVGERAVEHFKAPSIDARIRVWRGDAEMAGRMISSHPLVAHLRAALDDFEAERRGARDARIS